MISKDSAYVIFVSVSLKHMRINVSTILYKYALYRLLYISNILLNILSMLHKSGSEFPIAEFAFLAVICALFKRVVENISLYLEDLM